MVKKIKRVLYGYDPKAFAVKLEEMKAEFNEDKVILQQEMANLVHQRELLRAEVERYKQEILVRASLQNDISHHLFDAYFKATEHVLSEINSAEKAQKDVLVKVAARQDELSRIRAHMVRMTEEILTIAEQYEFIIDRKAGGHFEKAVE